VFGLLHSGIASGHLSGDEHGVLSVMSLAQRALVDADDQEGTTLANFARKLREAAQHQPNTQEEAA